MRERVAIFGPSPLLSVAIEDRGGGDDIHFHAGGQGVWVARMVGELGALPVLCGLIGAEPGIPLEALLDRLPGERRLVRTAGPTGSYVVDRREGERRVLGATWSPPASRHEVDELFSVTTSAALASDVLVVCNPFPADVLPLSVYGDLVSDVRGNGRPVLVDLSSPRLDGALAGGPDVVKLNDWELAQYVTGPVGEPAELRGAAERLLEAGAGAVVVTRGERPAVAFRGGQALEVVPPAFERGHREGCGDTMMGALAVGWARGMAWEECLRLGAAAGAASFLRHGLGSATRPVVEEMVASVEIRPWDS